MHFATSGVDVAPWLPPLVALAVSFATSMAGVSGAFLLLPFQMSFLGYTAPSVSATNHVFNVVATPSGVWRYVREGRMVWPLCAIVIAGGVPGSLIGALVRITWLRDPAVFKVFVAVVLLVIGGRMARDLVHRSARVRYAEEAERRFQALAAHGNNEMEPCDDLPAVQVQAFGLRTRYTFCGEEFEFSTVAAAGMSVAVGVVGGIYGIGGGALIAPLLVTFFDLPVYTIAGTALMSTFAVSVTSVGIYQALALAQAHPALSVAPDWPLGLLFGLGGIAGMYLGARCQKYVPSRIIKGMLAAVVLVTAVRYLMTAV